MSCRSRSDHVESSRRIAIPDRGPSQPARGFTQTPMLAVIDESPDIKTIRVQRPAGFDFVAGQFLPVRIRVDGKEQVRCYSISSSPFTEGFLEISVKRQGLVSNALHATARPGGILTVKAPNGHFTYPSGDDRPLVLLAGGVGITPLVSMLRYAVHSEPSRPVTLICGLLSRWTLPLVIGAGASVPSSRYSPDRTSRPRSTMRNPETSAWAWPFQIL